MNLAPDPERVVERPLKVLDLVVGAHVEHDEEDEGSDDVEEQVHPEDVDADVPLVEAQLRRPQHGHRPVGLGQRRVGQLVPGRVDGDALGVELEELGHVVDEGEDEHGDHEGPRRVHVSRRGRQTETFLLASESQLIDQNWPPLYNNLEVGAV